MIDAIDLHAVNIVRSPDVRDWPATLTITRIDMDPSGGLTLSFDRPVPDAWKWPSNPKDPTGNIQFTVWAITPDHDAAGFVEMWQGRPMGHRELPPIISGVSDWWGDQRRLWPGFADYVPRAGDRVGFFVTAGDARLVTTVTSVAERSNVVAVDLPPGDRGSFTFVDAVPTPTPTPTPIPDDKVQQLINGIQALIGALEVLAGDVDALRMRIDALATTGVRVHF